MITFTQILNEANDTKTLELTLFKLMNEVEAIPVPTVVFSFSLHWTLKRFFGSYLGNIQSVVNKYFLNLPFTYNLITSRETEDVRLIDGHTVIDVANLEFVIGSKWKQIPMIRAKVFASCDKTLWHLNDDMQIVDEWNKALRHFHHHMINAVAHKLTHYIQYKELIKTRNAKDLGKGTVTADEKVAASYRSPVEFGAFAYELARILYVHKIQPTTVTSDWLRDYVNTKADEEALKTYFTQSYADVECTFIFLVKDRLTQCYSFQNSSDENNAQLQRENALDLTNNRHFRKSLSIKR